MGPPARLKDYDCNTVCKINSTSSTSTSPAPSASSGMSPYSLTHFVDYNNFPTSYQHFLASMSIEVEPTRFSDVISNTKWRLAIK